MDGTRRVFFGWLAGIAALPLLWRKYPPVHVLRSVGAAAEPFSDTYEEADPDWPEGTVVRWAAPSPGHEAFAGEAKCWGDRYGVLVKRHLPGEEQTGPALGCVQLKRRPTYSDAQDILRAHRAPAAEPEFGVDDSGNFWLVLPEAA